MSRLAASTCLAIALAASAPGAAWAKSTDRNQPMDLDADVTDCSIEENGPCVFTGDVHVVQGTLDIRAAKADVRRANGDIQRVLLTGSPVRMQQGLDSGGTMSARASNVDYDMPKDIVTFTGKVEIDQPGRGTIASERVVYNMRTGQVQAGGGQGGKGGQVRTRILPKGAQQQAAPATPQGGG